MPYILDRCEECAARSVENLHTISNVQSTDQSDVQKFLEASIKDEKQSSDL